jgi:hypothetical protein
MPTIKSQKVYQVILKMQFYDIFEPTTPYATAYDKKQEIGLIDR